MNRFTRHFRRRNSRNDRSRKHLNRRRFLRIESLEDRCLLATFQVGNLLDSGAGSLRQAILDANAAPGADDIEFVGGGIGQIDLTSGQLTVNDDVTINSTNAGGVVINNTAADSRVFQIDAASVAFQDLTISGGLLTSSHGAGFYNNGGAVTLTNVTIDNNVVQSTGAGDRHGGGFWSRGGSVMGTNVQITDNRAERNGGANNDFGGGFWLSEDASVDITNLTLTGNEAREGGGFYITGGLLTGSTVTLNAATIDNNTAVVRGGGFRNSGLFSTVAIDGGSISGNIVQFEHGGGFYNNGTATLINTNVSNNQALDLDGVDRRDSHGGGFRSEDDATVTATRVNIDDNLAGYEQDRTTRINADLRGGGIRSLGRSRITLVDVTLDRNEASRFGGGADLDNESTVIIFGSTIAENVADNHGGGIRTAGNTQLTITNSTISGNFAGFERASTGGTPTVVQDARVGGGIWNQSNGTITQLNHVTVTNNRGTSGGGAGISRSDAGSVTLENSIVFGNLANFDAIPIAADTQNEIVLMGANIIGAHAGGALIGDIGNLITTDPNLAALANNGGPTLPNGSATRTHRITGLSSAAGQAINSTRAVDQRDRGRPATGQDLGAFEADPVTSVLYVDEFNVPQTGTANQPIEVSATAFNTGPGPLSFDWAVIDSGGATIATSSGATTTLTASLPVDAPVDVVTVQLTVTDTTTLQSATRRVTMILVDPQAMPATGSAGTLIVDTGDDVVDGDVTPVAALLADKGTDTFISLREAILAANAGATPAGSVVINIAGSVTTITLNSGSGDDNATAGDLDIRKTDGSIHIVGNGTTTTFIDGNALDRVFDIQPGAAAYFKALTITNGATTANDHGAGFRNQGGIAVLQDADLFANQSSRNNNNVGGGFYSTSSGTRPGLVFMTGGSIRDNTAFSHGGGFYSSGTNVGKSGVFLLNVTISGNRASQGGATDRDGGALDGGGNLLDGNQAEDDGGGFMLEGKFNILNLIDTNIDGNQSNDTGGGFFNSGGGQVIITSSDPSSFRSTISNNTVPRPGEGDGGAFHNSGALSLVDLTDVIMNGNVVDDEGGAFKTESNFSQVKLTRVDITNNEAQDNGGGFYVASDGSEVMLDTVLIDGNTSVTEHGGGFFQESAGSIVRLTGVDVKNNVAGDEGGGFFTQSDNSLVELTDVTIDGNEAGDEGGGFRNSSSFSKVTLDNVRITNNFTR